MSPSDKQVVRLAAIYTLSYLIPDSKHLAGRKIIISIRPPKSEEELASDGLSWHDFPNKTAYIWLEPSLIRHKYKKVMTRLIKLFDILVHELVHIRQVFVDGDRSESIPTMGEEAYWTNPCEVEALGLTPWLLIRLERLIKTMTPKINDDVFVDDKTTRKLQGKTRRKQKKHHEKEHRMEKVGYKKDKWVYDENKDYEFDDPNFIDK